MIFTLFFINFTDWHFDSLIKKSTVEKVNVQTSTNIKVTNTAMTVTTPNNSEHTQIQPQLTKEITKPNIQEKTLPEDEQMYKEEIAEAAPDEIEVKSIQKPIIKAIKLSIDSATKVKIKIKAKEQDGVVKAKVGITHDMLTYAQAKKKGREANFITHIMALVNKRVVYDASTSQFLSKNPLMQFSFKGQKGEELTIIYQQLKGELFYASKKIK
jgi:sulfur-oxidizing protein SoxZ